MSKAKIIALILIFIVCILPVVVMIWLSVFGWSFSVQQSVTAAFLFIVGLFAVPITAVVME